MDKRIGTKQADGTRELPELTISGNPVRPPIAGDIMLDKDHFIVLDALPTVDVAVEIVKLRATLPTPASTAIQPIPEQVLPGSDFTDESVQPLSQRRKG